MTKWNYLDNESLYDEIKYDFKNINDPDQKELARQSFNNTWWVIRNIFELGNMISEKFTYISKDIERINSLFSFEKLTVNREHNDRRVQKDIPLEKSFEVMKKLIINIYELKSVIICGNTKLGQLVEIEDIVSQDLFLDKNEGYFIKDSESFQTINLNNLKSGNVIIVNIGSITRGNLLTIKSLTNSICFSNKIKGSFVFILNEEKETLMEYLPSMIQNSIVLEFVDSPDNCLEYIYKRINNELDILEPKTLNLEIKLDYFQSFKKYFSTTGIPLNYEYIKSQFQKYIKMKHIFKEKNLDILEMMDFRF
ncbi:hypothetical protein [Leptospira bandrabouensis]|uniref:hypothetical protein n=1 Tax=Leptospira bandrabouensis TaxID=2484903 RepID=UPI001EE86FBE|nr:hypothetical protein [Leptospira bandrabouensis]MCG6146482.1 hypothetical protein [Leptospira bandrabouensis]MCG6161854.1 hypothetical protein [Leptospira bandrabouensis]MCG6166095.1 hypothetical protein [Leptospira bandrabouensis]